MDLAELTHQVNLHISDFHYQILDIKSDPLPAFVYHYTDVTGLIGILRSKKIWSTDYRYLNDSSEILYTTEVAHDVVRKNFAGARDELPSAFLEHIADAPRPAINQQTPYYLTCFSEQDNSLSQWRAYGGKQGFALKLPGDISPIPSDTLKIIDEAGESERQNDGVTLMKVIYNRSFHEEYVSRVIQIILNVCDDSLMREAATVFSTEELVSTLLPFYWDQIERASYRFKHPDFAVEREWRIVQWGDIHKEQYRSGSTIVPYIEVELRSIKRPERLLPLLGVRHGPSRTPAQTAYALDRILSRSGYPTGDCERNGSDTPALV